MVLALRLPPPETAIFFALLTCLVLAGCGLFGSEDGCLIEATGTVILAETDEPIEGLGVTLRGSGIVGVTVDTDQTDSDGRFDLRHDTTRPSSAAVTTTSYTLTVNDAPYDDQYTTYSVSVREARECAVDLGTVELEENTEGNRG